MFDDEIRFSVKPAIQAKLDKSKRDFGRESPPWLASWLAALTDVMLFLREEGREVRPILFVVLSDAGLASLQAPAGNFYGVSAPNLGAALRPSRVSFIRTLDGDMPADPDRGAARMVKELGNLYGGDWAPGVDLSNPLEPRLFCLDRPIRPGEGRWTTIPEATDVIAVGKLRDGHVRLVGGPFLRTGFDVFADPTLHSQYNILNEHLPTMQFLGAIPQLPPLEGLQWSQLVHTLADALDHCHGALMAVAAPERMDEVRSLFRAGCWFAPPVELFDPIVDQTTRHRLASLFHNVLSMDGVVVLSGDAKMHGYRCIVSDLGSAKAEETGAVGGARRTAFRAMSNSNLFLGVLMKSQNGGYARWDMMGYAPPGT